MEYRMSPAKAVDESGWETVVEPYPETFEFKNAGDTLTGVYESVKELEQEGLDGNPRIAKVYTIIDSNGHKWGVWGNYNVDLGMESVEKGSMVRFEFLGKVPIDNGARTVNQFDIKTKKA